MVAVDQNLITQLTTLQARTTVRYATYARHYEAFRKLPICVDESDRELQLSIAYLYHTSLSILEERKVALAEYTEDVKDVILGFGEIDDALQIQELRTNLADECVSEVRELEKELREIDRGITMAHRHERELMMD